MVGAGAIDRGAPVGDGHHAMTLTRERAGEHLAQIGLVVDDEDAERRIGAARRGGLRRGERYGTICDRSERPLVAGGEAPSVLSADAPPCGG